ncbi:MAG: hypothetical protein H6727_13775 [Myxococcales bacterium]|nr:hypothetical protein [Myxococcales bacterium]
MMWTLVPDGMGRLVQLHPKKAFSLFARFLHVNEWTSKEYFLFESPLLRKGIQAGRLYDRMIRRDPHDLFSGKERKGFLGPQELAFLEHRISEFVIFYQSSLVNESPLLSHCSVPIRGVGNSMRKASILQRYGFFFEVEPISLEKVLLCQQGDLLVRDKFYSLELLRYQGLSLDVKRGQTTLHFQHRLALSKELHFPLQVFRKRFVHFFQVKRFTPMDGVHLARSMSLEPLR